MPQILMPDGLVFFSPESKEGPRSTHAEICERIRQTHAARMCLQFARAFAVPDEITEAAARWVKRANDDLYDSIARMDCDQLEANGNKPFDPGSMLKPLASVVLASHPMGTGQATVSLLRPKGGMGAHVSPSGTVEIKCLPAETYTGQTPVVNVDDTPVMPDYVETLSPECTKFRPLVQLPTGVFKMVDLSHLAKNATTEEA